MDQDVFNFAGVMCVIIGSLAALGYIGTWIYHKFREPVAAAALPMPNFEERFSQLQQSVDAIAVEVERIAEGQRFSTKLLADNSRVPVARDPL
jgi:hypothetical protein